MDPSSVFCSGQNSFSEKNLPTIDLSPLSSYIRNPQAVESQGSIESGLSGKNPFSLPLRNFLQPEALWWADLDATFHFTDIYPAIFWAHPSNEYPARELFLSSYLNPQLIGNYNLLNWGCPGMEYFAYRRPEMYAYLYQPTPQSRVGLNPNYISEEKSSLSSYIEFVNGQQPDGLDILLSWNNLSEALHLALKTLRPGGWVLLRTESADLAREAFLASSYFEEVYLFKPLLTSPFDNVRFLVGQSRNARTYLGKVGDFLEVPVVVKKWMTLQNNRLLEYRQAIQRGDYQPLFPAKCYIKWNLPDQPPPGEETLCQPLVAPNKDLQELEKITGASLDLPWRTGTRALAEEGGALYLAQPGYRGGWRYLGEKKELCYIKP